MDSLRSNRLLTPDELQDILPAPPAASSTLLDWSEFRAERQNAPIEAEFTQPPLTHHLLIYYLYPSATLERCIDNRTERSSPPPGSFCVIPVGCTAKWRWQGEFDLLNILLPVELFSKISAESGSNTIAPPIIFESSEPLIQSTLSLINNELVSPSFANKIYAESLANLLVVNLIRTFFTANSVSRSKCSNHKISSALDYIHEHLAEDISLSKLAALVHLSPFYFSRVFKKGTGFRISVSLL